MFVPHLHFCGDCEETVAIYEEAFNTKAGTIIRDDNDDIVHAEMCIHGGIDGGENECLMKI